jgi:hypothetical protein
MTYVEYLRTLYTEAIAIHPDNRETRMKIALGEYKIVSSRLLYAVPTLLEALETLGPQEEEITK